jgi:hypothetical protein
MPLKEMPAEANRCPRCGAPLQELAYRWNPARGDFDVSVGCPLCAEGEAPAGVPLSGAASPAAVPGKPRK